MQDQCNTAYDDIGPRALRVLLGADLSVEDVKKLIDRADRDGNNVVDFQEFCWVCRGEYS